MIFEEMVDPPLHGAIFSPNTDISLDEKTYITENDPYYAADCYRILRRQANIFGDKDKKNKYLFLELRCKRKQKISLVKAKNLIKTWYKICKENVTTKRTKKFLCLKNWVKILAKGIKQIPKLLSCIVMVVIEITTGYFLKPTRVFLCSSCTVVIFSFIYLVSELRQYHSNFIAQIFKELPDSIYCSVVSFFGFGHGYQFLSIIHDNHYILCLIENILGFLFLSAFLISLARKYGS